MVGRFLSLVVTLLVVSEIHCQNLPPVVEGSYIAWGEIVQPLENVFNSITIQAAFEESYDAKSQNAAFFVNQLGKNLTFVKNHATNETYLYVETTDDMTVSSDDDAETKEKPKLRCFATDEKQWKEGDVAPGLLAFEDDDGTVRFSLTQLLNIPNKFLAEKLRGDKTNYRGIPAKSWMYEINTKSDDGKNDLTISIQSYWSDGSWNISAGATVAPLGFNVSKMTWSKPVLVQNYVFNVLGFVPDAYDHKYFKAIQGVVCPNRKGSIAFPNVKNIRAMSFHSELALPDYQELRYIDTWLDVENRLIRVDMERMDYEDPIPGKQKRYQSEIAIGQLGIVYRYGWDKSESYCEIVPFSKYKSDMQNLFDITQDLRRWQMGRIFGLNDTSYIYIGQATKNDIPCYLFQGIRTDWPDKDSNITSLWEWCFVVVVYNDAFLFQGDGFGLISANVIILSDPQGIYKNYRMNHHFYEVKAQEPAMLDATSFDIGRCFQDTEKRVLQFYLDVKIGLDNKMMLENATSDVTFLMRWKDAIYDNTGLNRYNLRISNVRATIEDDKVFIKFSILSVHKDVPEATSKKLVSAFDAEKQLRDNVNEGKVSIKYQLQKGNMTTLVAEKHSVSLQIDPKFEPQTLPPLTDGTTSTTKFVFSLKTEPDREGSSVKPPVTTISTENTPGNESDATGSDATDSDKKSTTKLDGGTTTPDPGKEKEHVVKYTGHQPGAVAGTAISVLLVGISIGASGTFYKFFGLPECMRR